MPCLQGLVQKTVDLSGGNRQLVEECLRIIGDLWGPQATPTLISNRLLKYIRMETGIQDPYEEIKEEELMQAQQAFSELRSHFPDTLEGAIQLSALGNSMDFFTSGRYDTHNFCFKGDVDKIKKVIYIDDKDVLMIGDNTGDFVFDMPLIRHLENKGREVYYAVRSKPAQNDLSLTDVNRFGLDRLFGRFISTGSDEVGINKDYFGEKIKSLWRSDAVVIAKGMGNYETISEFSSERPVLHVMKVKCAAVAHATGEDEGTYIALTGGE